MEYIKKIFNKKNFYGLGLGLILSGVVFGLGYQKGAKDTNQAWSKRIETISSDLKRGYVFDIKRVNEELDEKNLPKKVRNGLEEYREGRWGRYAGVNDLLWKLQE